MIDDKKKDTMIQFLQEKQEETQKQLEAEQEENICKRQENELLNQKIDQIK